MKDEPEDTRLYVVDHSGESPAPEVFEVRMSFSGETWFATEAEAMGAMEYYADEIEGGIAEIRERQTSRERELRRGAEAQCERMRQRWLDAVPCRACGWSAPEHPASDAEPPIVRGALDAAEKAGSRRGR